MPITYCFVRDTQEGNLSLEDDEKKQSKLVNKLRGMSRGKFPVKKGFF